MAKLSKGWTRLKVMGEVEPVLILVNRNSGKFGISLDEGENIQEHSTLSEAEAAVKEINESGAIDALIVNSHHSDNIARLLPIRVKRAHRGWARMNGTYLSEISNTLVVPDPVAEAALRAKHTEFEETKKRLEDIREEAWAIVKGMTPLDYRTDG